MQQPPSEWLKVYTDWAKIAGALVVFVISILQYRKSQAWKRREFIASQIKDFESDRRIELAMTMLDWNDRELHFPAESGEGARPILVHETLLCCALLPHGAAKGYTRDEAAIRDCFDRFLDMFVRLWNFVEADLISAEELRPYIGYWARIMSGEMKDWHTPQFFTLLLHHIKTYEFTGAGRLMSELGYKSEPSAQDVSEAITSILEARAKLIWHTSPDRVICKDPPPTPTLTQGT